MKKSKPNLNFLPELVKNNELSAQEAAKIIAGDVMKNSVLYRVPQTDEDITSELCLRLIQNSEYIFKHFNSRLCSFKTYLSTYIHYQIMNIIRDNYKADYLDEHIKNMSIFNYEEDENKYNMDETSFNIAHLKNLSHSKISKVPFTKKHPISSEGFREFFETKPEKKIKTTLVLALKASYYLTNDHIEKISRYCGIKKSDLQELVDEIKESLLKKQEKIETTKKLRDKSFQLHLKFQQMIDKASTDLKKQEYLKKYSKQTENWKKKNILLQEQALKLCPTNRRLAELLGICERQVGYYLQQAEQTMKNEHID